MSHQRTVDTQLTPTCDAQYQDTASSNFHGRFDSAFLTALTCLSAVI